MNNQDNSLLYVIIALLVISLFGGFGMMGYGGYGMMGMMYGNNYLCSQVGGIWCYFPIFGFLMTLIFWIAIILLVIWIIRRVNHSSREGRK